MTREPGASVWLPICPRVYRVAGVPGTWRQEILAACLSIGPDAVASHRSAARLYDIDGVFADALDVTVPRSKAPRRRGIVTHRTEDLTPDDVTTRDGIPVTKPARTLVDLGAVCPRWEVDRAIDDVLARRLVMLEGLWVALGKVARQGRSGAGVLRECLTWRFGVPDSHLEAVFLRLVRDFGLPEPVVQLEVTVGGRRRRIGAAYRERMLAVELDGAKKRMSPDALAADDSRQNDLVEAGWTPLRFTWTDLTAGRERSARRVRRLYDSLPPVLESNLRPTGT